MKKSETTIVTETPMKIRGMTLNIDGQEISRNQYMRECYTERNMSRSQIVDHLKEEFGQKVLFQQVYQATRDLNNESVNGRKRMITDSINNRIVSRSDLIKELYHDQKKTRSEIVKILASEYNEQTSYQIVFQATK